MNWTGENKPKSILGLDISTNSVAYCLNTPDGIKTFGEITFFGTSIFERIADAQKRIKSEFPDIEYDMILFESAVYIQNKRTVIQLAYAYGAVISNLVKPRVPVDEITPLKWQPAIGNHPLTKDEKAAVQRDFPDRKASWYTNKYREIRKERTKQWVVEKYGLNVGTDNQADAVAISHVGVDLYC